MVSGSLEHVSHTAAEKSVSHTAVSITSATQLHICYERIHSLKMAQ